MSNEEISPRRFDVFSIREYRSGNEMRKHWLKVGMAFENRDGSWNLRLEASPLPNRDSGLIELHMRPPRPREEGGQSGQGSQELPEQEEMQHFNYRPYEPADAADLI